MRADRAGCAGDWSDSAMDMKRVPFLLPYIVFVKLHSVELPEFRAPQVPEFHILCVVVRPPEEEGNFFKSGLVEHHSFP